MCETRACSKCGESKPLTREFFSGNTPRRPRFERQCRVCKYAKHKQWEQTQDPGKRRGSAMKQKLSAVELAHMLRVQSGACAYCAEDITAKYAIDHKTPRSRGGSDATENLHLTCARCNAEKYNRTHTEHVQWRAATYGQPSFS